MIKVLLVDDEDIEREAMAEIIPWEKLDMQLMDMAWNGIEGLEKIKEHVPDLVITDIKMPVMDGIQLIRAAKEFYPDMAFVVLSGYGEYEYTSRAMELGIRHYILKPCDEQKIVEVLQKVKQELAATEDKRKSEREYQRTFDRMLPRVKEQILGILIRKKEVAEPDKILLAKFMEGLPNSFILLEVQAAEEFNQLDRFVLTNILSELAGVKNIYMSTFSAQEMIYLLPAEIGKNMEPLMKKAHREYAKYKKTKLRSAISKAGGIEEVSALYLQLQEMFFLADADSRLEFINADSFKNVENNDVMVLDYERLKAAENYAGIMLEIYAAFVKMQIRNFSPQQIGDSFRFFLKIFCGREDRQLNEENNWQLLEAVIEECAAFWKRPLPEGKDGQRMKDILYGIYQNIKNPDLSLQYLAREVLFMNEDYFGRFFYRCTGEKYSAFLVRIRVELALRLMSFEPEIRISELAEQVGYPADGQYFAKVFKKSTGKAPSEYRKELTAGSDESF